MQTYFGYFKAISNKTFVFDSPITIYNHINDGTLKSITLCMYSIHCMYFYYILHKYFHKRVT